MANLRLYFEMLSKTLASTEQGQLGFVLPTFRQEDVLELELSVIRKISELTYPRHELVNISAWSMRVTIGTAGSSLASATSFTIDSTGTKLVGALALNTAGINALTDGQEVYFELIATESTNIYGKRFPVKIEKAIFTSGTLVAPADDTALGRTEGFRSFVAKEGAAGEGFILKAENGVRAFIYLDNDGQLRASPIA